MIKDYQIYSSAKDLPWVVLINGLFAKYVYWEESAKKLAKNFQVLCYNCRGQDDHPIESNMYTLANHVNDLYELLKYLAIDQVNFVGISNGGRVALKFASLYPKKCIKVVACDTYDQVSVLMKLKIESWLKAQEVGGQRHRFEISTPWIFGESYINNHEDLVDDFKVSASMQDSKAMAALMRGALDGEVDLSLIDCPVLYLVGDEDLLTPVSLHEKMSEKTKDSKVMKIKGGHASLYEYPENIDHFIYPYLTRSRDTVV